LLIPPHIRNSSNGLSIIQFLSGVESQASVSRWSFVKCVVLGLKKSGKTTFLKTLLGETQVSTPL
jgi:ABC-type branched-subunit amino acid transport system ATPase component